MNNEDRKREYKICKVRKHQKSGMRNGEWDVCEFCLTQFRYVTKMEEQDAPE